MLYQVEPIFVREESWPVHGAPPPPAAPEAPASAGPATEIRFQPGHATSRRKSGSRAPVYKQAATIGELARPNPTHFLDDFKFDLAHGSVSLGDTTGENPARVRLAPPGAPRLVQLCSSCDHATVPNGRKVRGG